MLLSIPVQGILWYQLNKPNMCVPFVATVDIYYNLTNVNNFLHPPPCGGKKTVRVRFIV